MKQEPSQEDVNVYNGLCMHAKIKEIAFVTACLHNESFICQNEVLSFTEYRTEVAQGCSPLPDNFCKAKIYANKSYIDGKRI